jgi:hypothetical protein
VQTKLRECWLNTFVGTERQTKDTASMTKSKVHGDDTESRNRDIGRIFALFQPLIHLSAARWAPLPLQSITATGAHFGQPGYETDLLYLACLVALVLGGSGPFAVDNWLFRWLDALLTKTRAGAGRRETR